MRKNKLFRELIVGIIGLILVAIFGEKGIRYWVYFILISSYFTLKDLKKNIDEREFQLLNKAGNITVILILGFCIFLYYASDLSINGNPIGENWIFWLIPSFFFIHGTVGLVVLKNGKLDPPEQLTKKKFIRQMIIGGVIGLCISLLIFFIYTFIIPQMFDKKMMQTATEINKTCPKMLDQYTRLEKIEVLPNNVLQYNYTLVNLDKTEGNLDIVKKYIEQDFINNVKTNPEMKEYRNNKTTINYNCKDKNGVFVFKISVTPKLYSKE